MPFRFLVPLWTVGILLNLAAVLTHLIEGTFGGLIWLNLVGLLVLLAVISRTAPGTRKPRRFRLDPARVRSLAKDDLDLLERVIAIAGSESARVYLDEIVSDQQRLLEDSHGDLSARKAVEAQVEAALERLLRAGLLATAARSGASGSAATR